MVDRSVERFARRWVVKAAVGPSGVLAAGLRPIAGGRSPTLIAAAGFSMPEPGAAQCGLRWLSLSRAVIPFAVAAKLQR